jgi:hypothetical protein
MASSAHVRWTLALCLTLPVLSLAFAAQQTFTLVVSGQPGSLNVLQNQGRNYIDVDALARLINGSLSYNGNQIVLTLPATIRASNSTQPPGFSKAFLTAGIEDMARLREWHSALKTGIERGIPLNTTWLNPYQAKAGESLTLASVAATTDSDKNGFQLLSNVADKMKTLTDKYLQLTSSQTYFAPDSLQSDPLDQTIIACGRSLASMAASKQFVDDGSCQ